MRNGSSSLPGDGLDRVDNAYAPPSAGQSPKVTRKSWVTRVLIGLGAGVVCLVLVGIVGAVLSYRGRAEIKPAMVNLANEFAACSLAHDRACVLRLSNWDASTIDKGEQFVDAVNRKLGKCHVANRAEHRSSQF